MSQSWDPINEFQRQFSRILQSIEQGQSRRMVRLYPLLNLYDRGDAFQLVAEVPGTDVADIEVMVAGDTVQLRGERKRVVGVGDEAYRRQERLFGRWSRTITLPESIDPDGVTADCCEGRLVVTLPRDPSGRPRRIKVSTTNG